MGSLKRLLLLMAIPVLMTGCGPLVTESEPKIIAPANRQIWLRGTWVMDKVLESDDLKGETTKEEWVKKRFQFSEEYLVMGDHYLEKPRYMIKRVDCEDYLLYNQGLLPRDLNYSEKYVDVVTVTDNDRFISEILRVNDQEAVLRINNASLHLYKISDEVEEEGIKGIDKLGVTPPLSDGNGMEQLVRTGVLVGLKSPVTGKQSSKMNYQYRTLWIAAKNKELHPTLEIKDIFFPRKSGFWMMEVRRNEENGAVEDLIYAWNTMMIEDGKVEEGPKEPLRKGERVGRIVRSIHYVGNDYVAIESIGAEGYEEHDQNWVDSKLRIIPVDSLPFMPGVKIMDLGGKAGEEAVKVKRKRMINELNIEEKNLLNQEEWEESLGLERRMGHWFLKGRISYRDKDKFSYVDHGINVLPPSKLIFYDKLWIPWTDVKDRVPGAVDVYTSPNQDIAIIVTKTELMIYGIHDGQLDSGPVGRVELKAEESVIMAEWATGRYVDLWEKAILDRIRPVDY